MKRKVAGASFVMALLFSVVCLMFVSSAEANPLPAPSILEVYIRSDGTVDPATVPIQREGDIYTFTGDLTNSTITVECDNIVIDGADYKLQGNYYWWDIAITLENRRNVIIKNIDIRDYVVSIQLTASSNIIIYNNSMLTDTNICLDSSPSNQIVGNNITSYNTYCIQFDRSSSNNLVFGNSFYDAGLAVDINSGGNNTFYLNNFVDNFKNVQTYGDNVWDNGSVGNFWSDYNGTDADGDGVGDIPYTVEYDDDLRDRYPLMVPFDVSSVTVELPEWMAPPSLHVVTPENATYTADVALDFTVNKQTSWLGYSLDGADVVAVSGNITLSGLSSGLHNVTVYAEDMFGNTVSSETVYFTIEEPFPTVPVAAASAGSVIVVAAALLVYFKKRKR
jgi:nitrous oxidase accessory protein NosD